MRPTQTSQRQSINIFNKPRNSEYTQEPRESTTLKRNAEQKASVLAKNRQVPESEDDSQSSYTDEDSPVPQKQAQPAA